MEATSEYKWILITGGFAAFFTAFSIGANDVANTFSSAIGGKSISLKSAVILGSIFEVIGATFFGGMVINSIRNKIIDFNVFSDDADILMLGMLCCLMGSGLLVYVATQFSLPISTTHSVVGSLIGFAIASGNWRSVKWSMLATVGTCWIFAPLVASLISSLLFSTLRHFLLRRCNSIKSCYKVLFLLMLTSGTLLSYFLLFSSPFSLPFACIQRLPDKSIGSAAPCYISGWAATGSWLTLVLFVVLAITLTTTQSLVVYVLAKNRYEVFKKQRDENNVTVIEVASTAFVEVLDEDASVGKCERMSATIGSPVYISGTDNTALENNSAFAKHLADAFQPCDTEQLEDEKLRGIHSNAESFDPEVEVFFSACHVIGACMSCLAHSTNDVANAVGPFSVIYSAYMSGTSQMSDDTPWYVLLCGGVAMALGLTTLGYKVISTMGYKLVKITPSRGFSIDVAAALTVMLFSGFGIPLSTTHSAVGSAIGVGLTEKAVGESPSFKKRVNDHVNWKLLSYIVTFWILTLVLSASATMVFFSYAAYAPTMRR